MSWLAIAYYTFMFLWIFGGIALFTWVKWETLRRKQREARASIWQKLLAIKAGTLRLLSFSMDVLFMLAPFLIPIAVTALTFIFEPK